MANFRETEHGIQERFGRDEKTHRYELYLDADLAGFIRFSEDEEHVALTHTEIISRYEGKGLGSRLADYALQDITARGKKIVPYCPFIAKYLRDHEEYLDAVVWPPR